jgi:predicted enzyme related to lactoylglutathione lyase
MPERTSYAPGTPSWVDIGTDVDAALPFYTALFGWSTEPAGPPEEAGGYGFFLKDGKQVAGYGPQGNPGPPVWSTYVTVADVEEAAGVVTGAGGAVVVPPMDVMTAGRMAVCRDPQGGFFSVWQPIDNIGAEVVNEPGAFCWNEIQSRDIDGSKTFYTTVFGWEAVTHEAAGPMGAYTEFRLDGQAVAGGMAMPPMVPPEVPTYWLVYFAVDDCEASVETARSLGATVLVPPMDVNVGRFAVLQDPQGATFAVIRLAG